MQKNKNKTEIMLQTLEVQTTEMKQIKRARRNNQDET